MKQSESISHHALCLNPQVLLAATCNLETPLSLLLCLSTFFPFLPIIRSWIKCQLEEMFTMNLVLSSLESVMQAAVRDISAVHHTIDSCRIIHTHSLKVI